MNTIKEKWDKLSDEDKSKVLNEFINKTGLNNIDYAKLRKEKEMVDRALPGNSNGYINCENPGLILSLVDPVLTHVILSWMYTRVNIPDVWNDVVPLFGFNIESLYFSGADMIGFGDREKSVLRDAVNIIKKKLE